MARENQGLQIALIVFVMFTIILGVTTFMFSKEYSKEKGLRQAAETKAGEESAAAKELQSENMQLKVVVGHAETATLDSVTNQFNTDMLTFAQNYKDADPNYRLICQWLFDEVQRKNKALSDEKDRVQQVKDQNASLEAAKEQQIQQLIARAKKAETDLAKRMAEFGQAQIKLQKVNKELEAAQAEIITKSKSELAKADANVKNMEKVVKNKDRMIEQYQGTIEELDPVRVDQPDGVITYAGRGDTVSINLGRADGLSRLTNFAVYSKDMTDVTTAGRKGAIEVIDLDDHSAVAQIIDEDISDPILPGDKIFTPLWKPGQREHFALTDGMDIDGDGRSDIDELRNLITSNGGIVDFWLDDEGNKNGEIKKDTKYLVEGERPTDGSTNERINARKWILGEQKRLNLRTMSLDELLNRMGYKRKVHVVRYDTKANPADFRAKAPEGVPRVSSGQVSDLFQKRNPPRPTVSSAY